MSTSLVLNRLRSSRLLFLSLLALAGACGPVDELPEDFDSLEAVPLDAEPDGPPQGEVTFHATSSIPSAFSVDGTAETATGPQRLEFKIEGAGTDKVEALLAFTAVADSVGEIEVREDREGGGVLGRFGPLAAGEWAEVELDSRLVVDGELAVVLVADDGARIDLGDLADAATAPRIVLSSTSKKAPLAVNTKQPWITGSLRTGRTLRVHTGVWKSPTPIAYGFRWLRCTTVGARTTCDSIPGATNERYTLTAADVGHTLRARVAARNAGGRKRVSSPRTQAHVRWVSLSGITDAELRAAYDLPAGPTDTLYPPAGAKPAASYIGPRLNAGQLAAAAYFRGNFTSVGELEVITRIGLAESSGYSRVRAWRPNHGKRPNGLMHSDRGSWQISSYWWPNVTDRCSDSPLCAARTARKIRDSNGFNAWVSYRTGAHSRLQGYGDIHQAVLTFLDTLP